MKAIGIVRSMDALGRLVIPMEIRKSYDIKVNDPIEIYTGEDGTIILKKYLKHCSFCSEDNQKKLKLFKEKFVCNNCVDKLGEII